MREKEKPLYQQAQEYADRRCPPPRYRPSEAGCVGAFITMGVLMVFMMLSGLRPDDYHYPSIVTLALGFLAPYIHYKRIERRNFDAYLERLTELQERERAEAPPF